MSRKKKTTKKDQQQQLNQPTNRQKTSEKNKGRVYRSIMGKVRLLLADIVTITFEKTNHCPTKKTTGTFY